MTVYLDTSVLIAALVEDEPAHEPCLALVRDSHGVTWSHALAEAYSTLTGGRLGIRVSPTLAAALIRDELCPRLRFVDLPVNPLQAALAEAAAAGARGGAIYDYLHLGAARHAAAQVIYTLDTRDFVVLARPGDPRIERPDSLGHSPGHSPSSRDLPS